ncbi:MAG: deoxycytidylate deaminase [Mesorhizobium sp.]|nr:MAG: deoxycytidylate deaminase [Mesorhizobium sp.]
MARQSATIKFISPGDQLETNAPSEDVARPTEELIIGMVGAVGAGVSKTASELKIILEREYDYNVEIVKASDLIRESADKTTKTSPATEGSERIKDLQIVGTELREKYGEDYIAMKAIERIAIQRKAGDGYDESTQVPQPKRLRQATIIDSLKHPKETSLLRQVYGGIYWQFTVFAPEAIRENRLRGIGIGKDELPGIFTRDENDKEGDHGQKVSKTAYLSDFFIRNDGENDVRLISVLQRYLGIIFNTSVHTPTTDEAGMYAAVSAASKSACLSRQVGAAIYSEKGELISVGWNDVPKPLGGLYSSDDGDDDHRCYLWGAKLCHNDRKKEELYDKIFKKLETEGLLASGTDKSRLRSALIGTPVRDLIEYSRSIHAEMEAIVSAGRAGKPSMVGGTLYTTTFPCHNCARHIVAAGISRVFYVEPYAKSLALELHSDAISMVGDDRKKVAFLQYEGVGPDSVLKLFHHGSERKVDGKARTGDKKTAIPVLLPPMDGFTTHEKRVIDRLERIESQPVSKGAG